MSKDKQSLVIENYELRKKVEQLENEKRDLENALVDKNKQGIFAQ